MVLKIEKDHQRFRQIVKGRIRDDLRKFLTKGELIGKEGKHLISIPVRGIDLRHFRYGDNSQGVGAEMARRATRLGKASRASRAGLILASTSWRLTSAWTSWRIFLPRSSSCRGSSPKASTGLQ